MTSRTRIISWNGLQFSAPSFCEEIVSSDCHLLIESDYRPVFELRWEKAAPGTTQPSMQSLSRRLLRKSESLLPDYPPPFPFSRFIKERGALTFGLDGAPDSCVLIWQCPQCNTLISCYIHDHPTISGDATAVILSSLVCHKEACPYTLWSVQDFRLQVPSVYQYDTSYFGAGVTRLSFHTKTSLLHAVRLAPAGKRLAGITLKKLFQKLHERLASGDTLWLEKERELEGRTAPSLLRQIHYRLRRTKAFCSGRIVHNEEADRIFALISESNKPLTDPFTQIFFGSYESIP